MNTEKTTEREAAVLAMVLHEDFREQAPGHAHNIPGQWDKDGAHCGKCAAWKILREWAAEIRERMDAEHSIANVIGDSRCLVAGKDQTASSASNPPTCSPS